MSALECKADIDDANLDVSFWPKTDIQHGAHGGLEKQARRPHGRSHTKHEDGDGVHLDGSAGAEVRDVVEHSHCNLLLMLPNHLGNDCARKRFSRACRGGEYRHQADHILS